VQSADEPNTPVKAKAVLVDPGSMTVVWMNESASQDLPDQGSGSVPGVSIDEALSMTGALGVPEAVRAVASTGVAKHLRTDLVSTVKGRLRIATSIYRLPDGTLLVLTENAWQAEHKAPSDGASRRSGRRGR
jgi:hypothetical protein